MQAMSMKRDWFATVLPAQILKTLRLNEIQNAQHDHSKMLYLTVCRTHT